MAHQLRAIIPIHGDRAPFRRRTKGKAPATEKENMNTTKTSTTKQETLPLDLTRQNVAYLMSSDHEFRSRILKLEQSVEAVRKLVAGLENRLELVELTVRAHDSLACVLTSRADQTDSEISGLRGTIEAHKEAIQKLSI